MASQVPSRYVAMPRMGSLSGGQFSSSFPTPSKTRKAFPSGVRVLSRSPPGLLALVASFSAVDDYVRVFMIDLVMPDLVESVQKGLVADIEAGFRADASKLSEVDWMYEELDVKPF